MNTNSIQATIGKPMHSGHQLNNSLTRSVFGFNSRLVILCLWQLFALALPAAAQTFTNLHSFTGSDGANPLCSLVLSGHALYGTTSAGGSSTNGTVFAINTDGSSFTNMHNFTPMVQVYEGSFPIPPGSILYPVYAYTNTDGADPTANLISSGNTLYGTASAGGNFGNGTIFAIHTDGTGFTNLYNFTAFNPANAKTNNDGAGSQAGLILSGNR